MPAIFMGKIENCDFFAQIWRKRVIMKMSNFKSRPYFGSNFIREPVSAF